MQIWSSDKKFVAVSMEKMSLRSLFNDARKRAAAGHGHTMKAQGDAVHSSHGWLTRLILDEHNDYAQVMIAKHEP
jgi:hypothetical protein